MSSNRTQSSRTTSPGSVGSSSDEEDEAKLTSKLISRLARDTTIQSKKTKSTKSNSSPARSSSPHRNTENCSGRNSHQTKGHDEERNHEGAKTAGGRDGGGGGGRGKESDAAVDVATRGRQHREPKFEPRLIHYKNNPMLGGMKRDTDHYYQHRRKVDRVKPVVDNRPPQFFAHVYCNMKRLKIQRDRQDVIENENQRLLRNLVSAMTTTRVDNWNSNTESTSSDLGQRQRRENIRIENENRKMKERIENRKATHVSCSNNGSSGDKANHRQQQNKSKERSTERGERDVSERKMQPSKTNKTKSVGAHLLQA